MIFKHHGWKLFFRILLLFGTLLALAFLLLKKQWMLGACTAPVALIEAWYIWRDQVRVRREMQQFIEAVHYRDFTRNFGWKNASPEIRMLRQGFNEINNTFRSISREKETQYQYLQKILELVNTGILSFEAQTGEVLWMNESLKKLIGLPYLKYIGDLEKRDESLYAKLAALKTGESKVIPLKKENSLIKVLLTATAFQTQGKLYHLIAFQNVNEVMDETESLAWQKLLNVMTHEIMNSVAPIASLADTLKKRVRVSLSHPDTAAPKTALADLELGIDTIKRRSEGLTRFAETYRNLSRITDLQVTTFLVRDLFENIYQLMEPTLARKNIEIDLILHDPSLTLEADRNLVEQVLINLVINATEAVKESPGPRISLSGGHEEGRPVISVIDNGKGISEALVDKIFVPFFSTRKNGNGIGLSLCKQIMLLHQGRIEVHTLEGKGTSFRLVF
jgi:nitrogen fixation/metabolism regulation signal transduction histidine kinase